MADGRRGRGFRRDVEGLRAVAILLVVLYHVGVPHLSGGYVGVDVFFVISGFLITGQLTRELGERGSISFLGFYARRARRILPAAVLTVATTAVASAVILNPLYARRTFTDATAATLFVANFRFAAERAGYFSASLPPSPLQHFWSLSVEEQFYLLWPVLLVAASLVWLRPARHRSGRSGRPRHRMKAPRPSTPAVAGVLGVLAVASLAAAALETSRSPDFAYYSIASRGWELAVGALAALALPRASRLPGRVAGAMSWAGLAAIAVAATAFSAATPYPGHAALLPVLGAAAVVVGGSVEASHAGARLLLGTSPFQRLGAWSYSWYLWHWPFLILAPHVLGRRLSVPQALAVAGLSLVVAVVSFVAVERPIRRLAFVARRPAVGLAGAAALGVASVAAITVAGGLVPSLAPRPPTAVAAAPIAATRHLTARTAGTPAGLTPAELTADLAAGLRIRVVPADLTPPLADAYGSLPVIVRNGCHLQHAGTRSKPCVYGDAAARTTVVLFGDSHAAAWFPGLDVVARRQHWRLLDLSKAGCPPVVVAIRLGPAPYGSCTRWRENAFALIRALHPALVVTTWARYLEEPEARPLHGPPTTPARAWAGGVGALFRFLHGAARHSVFLSDGPTLPWLAPDCVAGHEDDVTACTVSRARAVLLPAVKAEELALARQHGIVGVDPTGWFCAPAGCPVIVGNILLYRDMAHMVPAWSRFIAPVLAAVVVPVVTGKAPSPPP